MKTIFSYEVINKLFFMKKYKEYYNNYKNMVCKLNKKFYKLKQFL